ncbi:MAG: hypothetical protein K6T83_14680 [Alicyclobacillus sp.]|nr:hypothetical protein [Alicyclobacillus sp.]
MTEVGDMPYSGAFDRLVDIHTHVLPGLDDGPQDMDASRQLLKLCGEQGVDRLFCTSHYGSPHFDVTREAMVTAFEDVRGLWSPDADGRSPMDGEGAGPVPAAAEVTGTGVPGTIAIGNTFPVLALGAEVRLTASLLDELRHNTVPTLGQTRYVLLEFPSVEIPKQALDWIYELRIRRFRPIMAHPERVLPIQKNPALVDELVEHGVLMQLTASCFLSDPHADATRTSSATAWSLLMRGCAGVIASDSHNTTTRPPALRQAYEAIAAAAGEEVARRLQANAEAIWADEPCDPVPSPATLATTGLAATAKGSGRGGRPIGEPEGMRARLASILNGKRGQR